MNDRAFQFFLQFHHALLRKGPGTDAATAEAFRCVQPLLPPSSAIRTPRPLLRGPGVVVVTDAAWLRPAREAPPDVRASWAEAYPAVTDVEGNLALARQAGFAPLAHFTLPAEGWAAYVGR